MKGKAAHKTTSPILPSKVFASVDVERVPFLSDDIFSGKEGKLSKIFLKWTGKFYSASTASKVAS